MAGRGDSRKSRRGMIVAALITMSLVAGIAGNAFAQSSGPQSPTTVVDDASTGTGIWSFPGNATSSNNLYAQAPSTMAGAVTHYLKATGFGFAIPVGAVINGIELRVEKRSVGARPVDNAVRIVKGGVIGASDRSDALAWPTTDTIVTYGSPTDLWGETWTVADINGVGFGAAISARQDVSGVDLVAVDHMTLTVYYSVCGDNIIGSSEDCDDGNTSNGDCCSSTCQFESSAVICRGVTSGVLCDEPEFCTGGDGTCPPDSFKSPTVQCRAVTPGDVCDEAEYCTGVGPNCPPDTVLPGGAECRGAAGECDLAETCDGSSKSCPADAVKPSGAACAEDGSACTLDACDGAGNCAHTAGGSCDLIPGRVMVVKPTKLAKFVSKGTFTLPPPSDNPLTEGGSIRFRDTANAAGDVVFNLPSGGWKGLGNPAGSKGYKYKGAGSVSDPCKVVIVKPKIIKAVCKGSAITLTPPYAGNGAAVIRIGTATTRYCAEFGGIDVKNSATVFKRKNAPQPATCAEAVPSSTPVSTHTPTPTKTPISTFSPTVTNTATATRTDTPPPGPSFTPTNTRTSTSTPTITSTPTLTNTPAIHTCAFDGTVGGDNSSLQICFLGVCPAPFDIAGAIDIECDPSAEDVNGKRPCECTLDVLDPFVLSGIGTVCVTPFAGPCPDGEMDCDGGNALNVDIIGEHCASGACAATSCSSNANCATQCTTYCGGIGKAVYSSGCEGFCQGGTRNNLSCICDTAGAATCTGGIAGVNDCPSGSCEGKDNDLGMKQCHCTCIDDSFGAASSAGSMNCRTGVTIVIEAVEDGICDGNVIVRLPGQCAPFTSGTATGILLNDNEGPGPLGPYSESGANDTCTNFDTDITTGYELATVLAFYDSTIGDIIARLNVDCQ